MVNIGEGKKFLTEWMDMDEHGFTKKDVEKRKNACEKTGTSSKLRKGSWREETEKHVFNDEDLQDGFEHLMKSTGRDTC